MKKNKCAYIHDINSIRIHMIRAFFNIKDKYVVSETKEDIVLDSVFFDRYFGFEGDLELFLSKLDNDFLPEDIEFFYLTLFKVDLFDIREELKENKIKLG